jgi:hypothetical protein
VLTRRPALGNVGDAGDGPTNRRTIHGPTVWLATAYQGNVSASLVRVGELAAGRED